jgi:hypothetical protein
VVQYNELLVIGILPVFHDNHGQKSSPHEDRNKYQAYDETLGAHSGTILSFKKR